MITEKIKRTEEYEVPYGDSSFTVEFEILTEQGMAELDEKIKGNFFAMSELPKRVLKKVKGIALLGEDDKPLTQEDMLIEMTTQPKWIGLIRQSYSDFWLKKVLGSI